MINLFLRAKHWQLFLLGIGSPVIIQIVATILGTVALITDFNFLVISYALLLPVMLVLFMGTIFGWLWSIATGLQNKIPANVNINVTKFKIFFFIPLFYIGLVIVNIILAFNGEFNKDNPTAFGLIGLAILLHLVSMFCTFYCFYFVSKILRTVELQREVYFNDFAGDFFLVWFYPIGVWIIQPRVNKLAEG